MGKKSLSIIDTKRILELFNDSDDNNSVNISKITGFSTDTVCKLIDRFFDKKIDYIKPEYKIFHSKINY